MVVVDVVVDVVVACIDDIFPSVRHKNASPFCKDTDCTRCECDSGDDVRVSSAASFKCNDSTISSKTTMDRMNGKAVPVALELIILDLFSSIADGG